MDFKFLNDRYMRGKETVHQYLSSKHRCQCDASLITGHSTIVEMQAALGPNGFLNFIQGTKVGFHYSPYILGLYVFHGNWFAHCVWCLFPIPG